MAKESERMRALKENFMTLHQEGYGIPEIAQRFNVSISNVYRSLQEIADANGVSRESLLQVVKTYPRERELAEERRRVRVNVEELRQDFSEAGKMIDSLIDTIDRTLKEEEENDNHAG